MTMTDAILPLSEIHPDPHQPRQQFDEQKERELTASIQEHGLLQPLIVRLDDERACYILVAGERRYRSCLRAGIKEVPVRVVDGELQPVEQLLLQLTENEERDSLKPMELAKCLQRLQQMLNCSRDELAKRVNKSPATISRSLSLLELPEDLQEMIDTGELPSRVAAELVRCQDPMLQREIATAVINGKLNRDQAVAQIQAEVGRRPAKGKREQIVIQHSSGMRGTLSLAHAIGLEDWETLLAWLLKQCRQAKKGDGDLQRFQSLVKGGSTQIVQSAEVTT